MLKNVICSFVPKKSTVWKLISWKHSFKRLNEEYEIAKKKKQALDSLFETGKISQSTHESFNEEIAMAMAEIEKQQEDLLQKMQSKTKELEDQIKTLEMLFANYEIQHVAGEVDEEIYQREINLLAMGLETAKRELEIIKEAVSQLSFPVEAPSAETPSVGECTLQETETQPQQPETVEVASPTEPVEAPQFTETVEAPQPEVEIAQEPAIQEPVPSVEEELSESSIVEQVEVTQTDVPEPPQENPPEALQEEQQENPSETSSEPVESAEESPPETEASAEDAENQET